ncbi:CLIP-associating protein 1-like isoform X3 [Clytia hemisphaerica]|uniref:CLIP-associating protein 1-like isoform X3 n=1 Tax=Clytia hemisphaerica TaxID=252671 RepID=UPI0034D687BC
MMCHDIYDYLEPEPTWPEGFTDVSNILNNIFDKFDQLQRSGNMVAQDTEADGAVPTPIRKKSAKGGANVRRSTSFSAGDKKKRQLSVERSLSSSGGSSAAASGAVDETDFTSLWEEVTDARVFSPKEYMTEFDRIRLILENGNNDWEKRVEALKELRTYVKIHTTIDNSIKVLKNLEDALKTSVKDLRSAVVREVCVTISYMSSILRNKFDYLAENLFPQLIILIPNSVKVMSSSAHATIRLIIKHTHSPRLVPIIISNLLTSKSRDIRRKCGEYLALFLETWDTSALKNHVSLIEEGLRKGISDADSEARAAVRRAFWNFADHYKSRADSLMQTFDSSKQKLLNSDRNLLTAGGGGGGGGGSTKNGGFARPTMPGRSKSNLAKRSGSSSSSNGLKGPSRGDVFSTPSIGQRSASQLEARRPTPSMTPRQKSYDDLKRHQVKSRTLPRERVSRTPQRSAASQPSSRTSSPKRMVGMPTYSRERSEDYMKTYSVNKTRIPTPQSARTSSRHGSRSASRSNSRQSSRDPSPTRPEIPGQNSTRSRNGQDFTEDAIWDALKKTKPQGRDRYNSHGSINGIGSDESDNSSISSRESNKHRHISHDFHEILHMLQQDASNTKRDGLTSFQGLLQSSMRYLNTEEAVRVKETFNRYFAEPNSKIYSSFLDVLSEFLVQYKNDLQDWLFILLTRLLQRLSTDILQSSQTKIARVLDVVRDSYPYDHQFQIITKYITDKTQTPSLNMKLSLLQYTRGLIALMDANDFTNSAVTRLAITRVITWMSEPKSADVRKESANVIVALFQLNPSEFSMVLSSLPNSIQEGATRAINIEIKNPNGTGSVSTPPYASTNHMRAQSQTVPSKQEHMEKPIYRTASPAKHASRIQMRDEYATGSPVTRTPLSTNSRQDTYGESASTHERLPIANKLSYSSPQESAVPNHVKATPETPYAYNTHYNSENSPMWLSTTKDMSQYNPKSYEDSLIESTRNLSFTSPVNRIADGAEQPDETDDGLNSSMNLLNEISTILSQHHRGIDSEDIKSALIELLKTMRSATNNPMLGQKLQGLLPSVMVMLKHSEATVRCLAIRCLREICQSHPNIYRSDLQSFLMPLLETESDNTKEVSKTAEECCNLISQTIPADELLPIIAPVCGSSNFPTNSSAIKMLNMVSDSCESSVMKKHIETVVPNLLKAYDHTESMVRKAACFCLVSVHNVAGPDLVQPYFQNLAGSKIKLLNLYIRRSQTSNV